MKPDSFAIKRKQACAALQLEFFSERSEYIFFSVLRGGISERIGCVGRRFFFFTGQEQREFDDFFAFYDVKCHQGTNNISFVEVNTSNEQKIICMNP